MYTLHYKLWQPCAVRLPAVKQLKPHQPAMLHAVMYLLCAGWVMCRSMASEPPCRYSTSSCGRLPSPLQPTTSPSIATMSDGPWSASRCAPTACASIHIHQMVSRCSPTVTSAVWCCGRRLQLKLVSTAGMQISSWHARWSEKFMTHTNLQLVGRSLRLKQPVYESQDNMYSACERHILPLVEPRFTRVSDPAV